MQKGHWHETGLPQIDPVRRCIAGGAGTDRPGGDAGARRPLRGYRQGAQAQVDGVKIGITTGKTIYLSHPQAREFSLGCRGANYSNELYVKADRRKPKPEFFQLVASAGAIVFTIPKPDVLTGSTRCINRMGLLRGDNVKMRFRRLNMECTRTKTEAAIAITRGKDE